MAKLTRRPMFPAIYCAVENDPGTDPLFDEDHDEIPNPLHLRPSKPQLGECRGICVVVNDDRKSCGSRESFGNSRISPPEMRNIKRRAAFLIDQAGYTDPDPFNWTILFRCDSDNTGHDFVDCLVDIVAGFERFLFKQPAGKIAGTDMRQGRPNVDADRLGAIGTKT